MSGRAGPVFRETDLDVGQSFKNHYEETKFLAEVAVRTSGLPATIYRPAIVVGDSRTGETGKFDGPYFILNAMRAAAVAGHLHARSAPGGSRRTWCRWTSWSRRWHGSRSAESSRGKTYHLTDPEPLAVVEVGKLLARALGKSFAFAPVPGAVARALFAPAAVQRFFGVPVEALDYFDHDCRYDTTAGIARSRGAGRRRARASRTTSTGWSRSTARTATTCAAARWSERPA